MNKENPFADFGQPISSDRFIGRDDELRLLRSRILGKDFGSLGIVGLPKIGKTSLVVQFLKTAHSLALERKFAVLPLIDVGIYRSAAELFSAVANFLQQEIVRNEWSNEIMGLAFRKYMASGGQTFDYLADYLAEIKRAGIRPIIILDELDAARYIFASSPEGFHWLRGICSDSRYKAAVILVSKRPMEDVARIAGFNSDYWNNILMIRTLRPFSDKEIDAYRGYILLNGVVSDIYQDIDTEEICGRHPFLLDAAAFYGWDCLFSQGVLDMRSVNEEVFSVAQNYYRQVATILEDAAMLTKFLQCVAGPKFDLTRGDLDWLTRYGVLSRRDGIIFSFSKGFDDFIRVVQVPGGVWPLWHNAEIALRVALESLLIKCYGGTWVSKMKNIRESLKKTLEDREIIMSRERERFGERPVASLLEYTYPADMFQIMCANWPALGEPILGSDRKMWSRKFDLLAKVRNPLAHNRDSVIEKSDLKQVEGICLEIIKKTKNFPIAEAVGS